jgi:hypothetical protein
MINKACSKGVEDTSLWFSRIMQGVTDIKLHTEENHSIGLTQIIFFFLL